MIFSHDDIRQHLVEHLYGALDAEARAAFDAHLASCAACRSEVDAFARARTVARAVVRAPLADDVPAGVRARVREAAARAIAEGAAGGAGRGLARPVTGTGRRWLDWFRAHWTLPTLGTVAAVAVLLLVRETIFREARQPLGDTASPERFRADQAPNGKNEGAPAPATSAAAPARVAGSPPGEGNGARLDRARELGGAKGPSTDGRAEPVSVARPVKAAKAHRAAPKGAATEAAKKATADGAPARRPLAPAAAAAARPPASPASAAAGSNWPAKQVLPDALISAEKSYGAGAARSGTPAGGGADLRLQGLSRGRDGESDKAAAAPSPEPSTLAPAEAELDDVVPRRRNLSRKKASGLDEDRPAAAPPSASQSDDSFAKPPPPPGAAAPPQAALAKGKMREPAAPPPRGEEARRESPPAAPAVGAAQQPLDSIAVAVARAERLVAAHRYDEAAAAYGELVRRFPRHADVPVWRKRLAAARAAATADDSGFASPPPGASPAR